MTDQTTEDMIVAAGATTAPRITPIDVEREIASEHYHTAADGFFGASIAAALDQDQHNNVIPLAAPTGLQRLTFCTLILKNGFIVTGESAATSLANYRRDIGQQIARESAIAKVFMLLSFRLRDQMHGETTAAGSTTGDVA